MASWRIKAEDVDESMLVPLVPKGRDREEVIEELIEAWAKPVEGTEDWSPRESCSPGVTLNRVDLVDQNTGEPVDLIELLTRLSEHFPTRSLRKTSLNGNSIPQAVPMVHCCLRGCRIYARNQGSHPLVIPCTFAAVGCRIVETTNFVATAFAGQALFDGTSFAEQAVFEYANFSQNASFLQTHFAGGATFINARFSRSTSFERTEFSNSTWFRKSIFFDRAWFAGTVFSSDASFADCIFVELVSFAQTSFLGDSSFARSVFASRAWFAGAAFTGWLDIDGGAFAQQPEFTRCQFSDQAVHGTGVLHCAKYYTNAKDGAAWQREPPQTPLRRLWFVLWHVLRIKTHWGIVRSVGELAILSRISLSALVVVPILAGLWPAIRAGVQRYSQLHWHEGVLSRLSRALFGHYESIGPPAPPGGYFLQATMPGVWAALFFAALFVVIGRAIYQAGCPQFVRERTRFDVMRDEMEEFRRTRESEGDRRLQEAIDDIKQAGEDEQLGWFWHPNLVRHNGRPVWIPSSVDDFAYEPREITLPEGVNPPEGREGEPLMTAPAVMSQTSREDIAIQQGASARYDIIARQNLGGLRASLWCYVIAAILVVLVVWKQALTILMEVGWKSLVDWTPAFAFGGTVLFVLGGLVGLVCGMFDVKLKELPRAILARFRGSKDPAETRANPAAP